MHQLWDKLVKIVGEHFPEEIIKFVFPKEKIKFCGKFEQERMVLEYQVADINFWILDKGVKKLLNIEPYSKWDTTIPQEVFTRNAIITKSLNYQYEVISVVILLEQESKQGKHEVTLNGRIVNQFEFSIVSLKDFEEILKNYPGLAPFILKVNLSLKDKVIEAIQGQRILKYVTVLILNRLGIKQKEALNMVGIRLEEFKQALLEVPIMQDVANDWRIEEKKTIAKTMLGKEMEVRLISEITGLTPEEIVQLKLS